MTIINTVYNKIKKNIGSSLTEMLATVLLMGLMGTAIASGIGAIQSAYSKIVRKANEQTLLSTTLIEIQDNIRYTVGYDSTTGRFHSATGVWFDFKNSADTDDVTDKGIQICYYADKNDPAPAHKFPVVANANGEISNVYSSFDSIVKEGRYYKITNLSVGTPDGSNATAIAECYILPIVNQK